MTESEAKIELSKKLSAILKNIYKNINENGFDLEVDLSSIPSSTLKDFWVYSSGFLGIKNLLDIERIISPKEAADMLNGKFSLKRVSLSQAEEIAKQAGKSLPTSGLTAEVDLYSIQDGTYSIKKGIRDTKNAGFYNCIQLRTAPVEYYSDEVHENLDPMTILTTIRNRFAHSTPYIKGNKLTFIKGRDEIVVSKMWLRGYAELFSKISNTISSSEIQDILKKNLEKTQNTLSTKEDIINALELIKYKFDDYIQKNYYNVNNFINNRIHYNKNFFGMSLDDKIASIASMCTNNLDYFHFSSGSMNSAIIYNLQKLVSLELAKRGESADLSADDYELNEVERLTNEAKDIQNEIKSIKNSTTKGDIITKKQLALLEKRSAIVVSQIDKYLKKLDLRQKLESSHMDIYKLDELKYIPVEVAVNTVLLMGFNSLVTSNFYQDVLKSTNVDRLSVEQSKFFSRIKMDQFNRFVNGQEITTPPAPKNVAFMLLSIRNAICHGSVSYTLPVVRPGFNPTYKDVILDFYSSKQKTNVVGRLQDFYELFSSYVFSKDRPWEIQTTKSRRLIEQEDESWMNDFLDKLKTDLEELNSK